MFSDDDIFNLDHDIYFQYHTFLPQKKAEKKAEKYIATKLKISTKSEVSVNNNSFADNGDLVNGDILIPGENNIEVKVCINPKGNVYMKQLHLHEKIKYFLTFGGWHDSDYFLFLLSLDDLVNFFRFRDSLGLEPFGSSQGTGGLVGRAKGNSVLKFKILEECISGKNTNEKLSFSYSSTSSPEQHEYMKHNHGYTFKQLREKLKKERIDI